MIYVYDSIPGYNFNGSWLSLMQSLNFANVILLYEDYISGPFLVCILLMVSYTLNASESCRFSFLYIFHVLFLVICSIASFNESKSVILDLSSFTLLTIAVLVILLFL